MPRIHDAGCSHDTGSKLAADSIIKSRPDSPNRNSPLNPISPMRVKVIPHPSLLKVEAVIAALLLKARPNYLSLQKRFDPSQLNCQGIAPIVTSRLPAQCRETRKTLQLSGTFWQLHPNLF
ncbi:hypothetical protein DSO57_1032177 [Entomophthora muscae]|uniref:Uncharacterized protein n=1 Tax=Entomophthora muscae TaxID=34485 RepID=A0ACC2U9H3_9FUNG|nr:hypothetical protein DSO57_1032177 [Entomophthora muscae]